MSIDKTKTLPFSWVESNLDYTNYNFYFKVKSKSTTTCDALTAALKTIDYIHENYPPPYSLCLSGGVDSQAMLYAWILSKKSFNTYVGIYNNKLNWYDVETLDIFKKLHNTQINYENFDLFEFLNAEHDSYARSYLCGSPQFTCHMKFADIINNGTVIYSGNFMEISDRLPISRNAFGMYHYSILSKHSIVPFFFLETKELAESFQLTDYVKNFNDPYLQKILMYQTNGFPVIPQYKKYNGFETVKEYFDDEKFRADIDPREIAIAKMKMMSQRNFDLLYRNKYESMFRHHKYVYL
jgi:hypothetical protein